MIVTCIQDNMYLSWQAELLALNCREFGRELTILIGWRVRPSDYALRLQRDFNAVLIEDQRHDLSYAPSIQPHLLASYCRDAGNIPAPALLVDSDVLFRSLDWLPESDGRTVYLSDCSSYLSADYLQGCDPDLLGHLCQIADISPDLVASHRHSGGAQYILPHLFDAKFWQRVERVSNSMHRFMRSYRCSFHAVQIWTASMWAILYELYRREQAGECSVAVDQRLDFCFATDPADYWQRRNILHMAGVTAEMEQRGYFFKGRYIAQPPWQQDFAHVTANNCSSIYVESIRRFKKDLNNCR